MKFDLYMQADFSYFEPRECVMWLVLPTACVGFLADGSLTYQSTYMVKLGLLNTDNWVKIISESDTP